MGKIQSMLTLDGESEYKRQLSLINASLKTLEKELQATSSQLVTEGNRLKQTTDLSTNYGRQMDFLKSKQEILRKAMQDTEKEVKNNGTRLDAARQQYASATQQVEISKNAVATWTQIAGENSREVANAKAALARYEEEQRKAAREVSQAEKAVERAAKAYINYKTQLADTDTAINRTAQAQAKLNEETEQANESLGGGGAGLVSTLGAVSSGAGTAVAAIEKLGSALGTAAGAGAAAFNATVQAVNSEINLGIKGVEAYAGAVATAGTAVGGFAASNGMSFEASMSKVQAYANLDPIKNAEEIKALTEAAKETGATTTKTATEAADALGFLALNGWKTEQMLSALLPVTKASEAGGIDLATVANLTARSLTAYGKGAEEAEDFLNILTAAQNNSSNSLLDLLTVYNDTAGTFKMLGVDTKESAALIGVLANQGLSGAEAATALNAVMLRLLGTNKKAGGELDKIGVSAWNDDGTFKGLTATLLEAGEALSNMTDQQRIESESIISGVMRFQAFQKVIDGVMDKEGYAKVFDPINSAIEDQALYNTAATMMDNLQGKVELFKSATSALGTSVYESFAGKATDGVQTVTHWVDMLNDSVKKTSENYEKIDEMNELFKQGQLLSGFKALSGFMSEEDLAELRSQDRLEDFVTEIFTRAETPVIDSIRSIAARASTELSDGIEKTSKLLPGKLKIFNTSVSKGAELLIQGIHESKDTLLPEIIQGATDLALDLADYLPQLTEDLADGAVILFDGILTGLDKVVDKLVDEGKLDSIIDTVNNFFDENGVRLWESGLKILTKIGDGILEHKDELIGTGLDIVNGIADDVVLNLPTIMEKADDIVQSIVTGLEEKETLEKLTGASLAIVQSLVRFFDEHSDELSKILTTITTTLQTEENQRKMLDLGMSLGSLIVKGILTSLTPVSLLKDAWGDAKTVGNEFSAMFGPQQEYGAGTTVEPSSGMKGLLPQPQKSEEPAVVNFNIQNPTISRASDIEWFMEEAAAAQNNAQRSGGWKR